MIFDPTGKEDCLMLDSSEIYRYIHGGQGVVTLAVPATMKAHSYGFFKPRNPYEFPEGTIFAYVFHNKHKMYLGILEGSRFRRTQRSTFSEDTEAVKGVRYIVKMSVNQNLVDKRVMNLYNNGTCCICGRPLSTDLSRSLGIGKKCLKKYDALLLQEPWDGN